MVSVSVFAIGLSRRFPHYWLNAVRRNAVVSGQGLIGGTPLGDRAPQPFDLRERVMRAVGRDDPDFFSCLERWWAQSARTLFYVYIRLG
jgi:hypothetical protein